MTDELKIPLRSPSVMAQLKKHQLHGCWGRGIPAFPAARQHLAQQPDPAVPVCPNDVCTTQRVPMKATPQGHSLTLSHPLASSQSPRITPQSDGPTVCDKMVDRPMGEGCTSSVACTLSGHRLPVTPAPTLYSPVQTHTLIKNTFKLIPGHKGAHNPLIIPKPAATHRQVRNLALPVASRKTPPPSPHCLSIHPVGLVSPATTPAFSRLLGALPVVSPSDQSRSTPGSPTQTRYVVCQYPDGIDALPSGLDQSHSPDPTLGPPLQPQLSPQSPAWKPSGLSPCRSSASPPSHGSATALPSPPSSPQPPLAPDSSPTTRGLQFIRELIRESEMAPCGTASLLSQEETESPTADAPESPPTPRTIAEDLQASTSGPPRGISREACVSEGICKEDHKEEGLADGQPKAGTPALSPPDVPENHCKAMSSTLSAVLKGGAPETPPGDPLRKRRGRSGSQSPPASFLGAPEREPPQAVVKPQILMHLVEGFVIQEGLEPFPVSRSSLMVEQQLRAPEARDPLMDVEPPEVPAEDRVEESEAETELLLCEFCGKRGDSHTFLRSQRFCSLPCVRRFNAAYTKRIRAMKANKTGRWRRQTDGRRGRNPGRDPRGCDGHFLRQLPVNYKSPVESDDSLTLQEGNEGEEEEPSCVTNTTGLGREPVLRGHRGSADGHVAASSHPALWTVDQVWTFIYNLPGCQDVAGEFRSQEIDGQALLLLTEDHLMVAMKLKLGPTLKICARINSLRGRYGAM